MLLLLAMGKEVLIHTMRITYVSTYFTVILYSFNISFGTAAEDEDLGAGGKKLRPGISSSIITELTECNAALSQQRKKRQVLLLR